MGRLEPFFICGGASLAGDDVGFSEASAAASWMGRKLAKFQRQALQKQGLARRRSFHRAIQSKAANFSLRWLRLPLRHLGHCANATPAPSRNECSKRWRHWRQRKTPVPERRKSRPFQFRARKTEMRRLPHCGHDPRSMILKAP